MFKLVPLLDEQEVRTLREIAASGQFVDGKISNPHSTIKNNLQLHDAAAYERSSKILLDAMVRNPDFMEFTFPARIAPPLLTRYTPGMHYGLHPDAAYIPLSDGQLRTDVSCTVFINDPADYDGGALHIMLGNADLRFKEAPGTAIVYPSHTLHEVEPVTRGERLVAITFIQSLIPDLQHRDLIYELNEVAALEGGKMDPANYTRLQAVQYQLLRMWRR
ncbi:Fe2+-dependent dioxygenase [Sphingopyxis lindanitolerans]|uniref:Fe2+-dependent dioxygenase n=1 Tax=Sphingopyxis lindanitolerans TaxID=2054227 RepID=A0A2S8B2Q3_9SPHN|nr:Fe2+-dependent dioxygenase [Sphingopyxis lindanitolerans]PQM26549.1 Fe2+-dependent dioxygenase [Sphingopyxis lindanitolerans]